jgi:hypothetical protein
VKPAASITRRHALCALLALLLGGCFGPRGDSELATPRSQEDWTSLIAEVRAFERQIGFKATNNFRTFEQERQDFPFCGYVSRLYLPYSYEDPAIQWLDVRTEEECVAPDEDADVTFGRTEAVGESETPVTSALLVAPLNRFLYLVIHEDCHEQFALPYGIEEPLCNVVTFGAMAAFAEKRFRMLSPESRAIQRMVREGAAHSRITVASYERLAALYRRHEQAELPLHALLKERARVFSVAEKQLAWPRGSMNNVWIANAMTYSRHHALIEGVHDALGGDLPRTVAFFRQVDAAKPTPAAVMEKHRLKSDAGVDFVRAYEAAVVETIERELAKGAVSVKPKGA